MRRLVLSTITAGILVLFSLSATLAVGLHQHVITTPSGQQAWIAQGICKNDLQEPIDNLHERFHQGAPAQAFATNPVAFVAQGCP